MPRCRITRTLLLGCAFALAGCDTAPTAAPVAGAEFDGIYIAQDTLVHGVAFQCGSAVLPERIEIRNGRFDYLFQVSAPRTTPLAVQAYADGTLFGRLQYGLMEDSGWEPVMITDWATLKGHLAGATLDATITTLRCARHLTAQRSEDANTLRR